MSDWNDACDPTQPVREREQQIKDKRYAAVRKRIQLMTMRKVSALTVRNYSVEREFDEMES